MAAFELSGDAGGAKSCIELWSFCGEAFHRGLIAFGDFREIVLGRAGFDLGHRGEISFRDVVELEREAEFRKFVECGGEVMKVRIAGVRTLPGSGIGGGALDQVDAVEVS